VTPEQTFDAITKNKSLQYFLENHWDRKFTGFYAVIRAYRNHIGWENVVLGQRQELINAAIIYAFVLEQKLEPSKPDIDLPLESFTETFKNYLDASFYPD
jgi:hypothetical protein